MDINFAREFVVNRDGLVCRRVVGGPDHTTDGGQFVVEPNRIIERVLAAAVFGLVERFLDFRHLFIEGRARIRDGFVVFNAAHNAFDLRARIADGENSFVRFVQFVAHFHQQIELFSEIFRRRGNTRVFLDDEVFRVSLAVDGQLNLIIARRGAWPGDAAGPHNQARKTGCIGVTLVPDETVQTRFRRRFRPRRFVFAGEFLDGFARRVENFQRHAAFRFVLQIVVDRRAARWICADRSGWRQREATKPAAANTRFNFQEQRIFSGFRVGHLIDNIEVVQNPKGAALRGGN